MKCPLKTSKYIWPSGAEECQFEDCLGAECAWWEAEFGKCCIAVDAYLKAVADHRLEREITRRGG